MNSNNREVKRPRRSKRLERLTSSMSSTSETMSTTNSNSSMDASNNPLCTIGLIADIQYAPIDDGASYSGTPRYYRHALHAARHAANHFQESKCKLVVNLGDTVDGKALNAENGERALDDVIDALSIYKHGPILHAYGNHCLYNHDRITLQRKLDIPFVQEPCGDLVGYYSKVLHDEKIRFIILDSYDVALMQRCTVTSKKRATAVNLLKTNNRENYISGLENSPNGLTGIQKRFVAFNGAVGTVQLEWLQKELQIARNNNEKVIIFSHQPIAPKSTNPVCLMWNYKEVLAVLRQYKDVVAASFAGHAHKGGYHRDDSGIHFRVLEATLESPDPIKTYAFLDIYDDKLIIRGCGHCNSAIYHLDHIPIH